MTQEDIQEIVKALKKGDQDSFATFTSGLRNNWVFLIAMVGVAMWIFNQFNLNSSTDQRQDFEIQKTSENVAALVDTIDNLATAQTNSSILSNQIQQDIALIKLDIAQIKEQLK